ncbi:MAG: dTDP-4-dehydrorhamnose reductase [Calditrichae bacterium]|nr:dTDP-4-dehydrorhamnose reductase [Calditrichota bacterium]MCB9058895.1 dTDP-4-dehydrorhamnose reductase [Calditrichia bacterium]
MKKIIVFGSNGLLGQSIVDRFCSDFEVIGASRNAANKSLAKNIQYHQIDMTNRQEMDSLLQAEKPDIIINCAAYTDVDGAENDRELCWNTNVRAVENIIDAAGLFKPVIVQVSTDYVFDGEAGDYRESDPVNPKGTYARSKMAAENILTSSQFEYIIARTQVLYGYGNKVKLNFATWVISRLSQNKSIRVVSDQKGNPTYIDDLSESIFQLIEKHEFGLYHISGSEALTRFEFARRIARVFEFNSELIEKIHTEDLKQVAPRPMDSTFILDKLINHINWIPGDIDSGLQRLKIKLNEYYG